MWYNNRVYEGEIFTMLDFIKSVIPFIPMRIVAYAVIKLLSSGLSVIAKVISTLLLLALTYWAVMYLIQLI